MSTTMQQQDAAFLKIVCVKCLHFLVYDIQSAILNVTSACLHLIGSPWLDLNKIAESSFIIVGTADILNRFL